jgi:hypothetical protein
LPAGRNPNSAAQRFREALGSVASCVTTQRLAASRAPRDPEEKRSVAFDEPVSLRSAHGGPSGLYLDIYHQFVTIPVERHWQVSTRMYEYRLLDRKYTEMLVYHWQPGPDFQGPDHPHLHVSAALRAQVDAQNEKTIDLDRLHIATGRVSFRAIVRMPITEFGVAPQRGDWRAVLDRTEQLFQDKASRFS